MSETTQLLSNQNEIFIDNWKKIDFRKRNIRRLESLPHNLRINALLIELIKNGLENSIDKVLHITTNDSQSYISFVNKIKPITQDQFLENLKTFGGEAKDTNYHEGLTLTEYVKCIIKACGIYLELFNDDSGFYLNAKMGKCEYKDEWSVEILLDPSKGYDRIYNYSDVKQKLNDILDSFYLLGKEEIIVNNTPLLKKTLSIDKFQREFTYNGYLRYVIQTSILNKSLLLWKLANIEVYQKIPSTQLDNLNIDGIFIFDNIKHFSNENRIELSSNTYESCIELINNFKKINADEDLYQNLLKRYDELKERMINFLHDITKISKENIQDVFFNENDKRNELVQCTKFIDSLNFIDNQIKFYSKIKLILFKVDSTTDTKFEPTEFKMYCNQLQWDTTQLPIVVGIEFLHGEIGDIIRANEIKVKNFYYVNSDEVSINKARKFKGNFIYMSKYDIKRIKYIFDLNEYNNDTWENEKEDICYEQLISEAEEEIEIEEEPDEEPEEENSDDDSDDDSNSDIEINQNEKEPESLEDKDNYSDYDDDEDNEDDKPEPEIKINSYSLNKPERTTPSGIRKEDDTDISYQRTYNNIDRYDTECGEQIRSSSSNSNEEIPSKRVHKKREIKDIKFKNVSIDGIDLNFAIINYSRKGAKAKIPFLYTPTQFKKLQKGYNVTTKVTITRWNAFKTAINLLVNEMNVVDQTIRPIFCYNEELNEAFYNERNGLLCLNLFYFEQYCKGLTKAEQVQDLLETVCHELAHIQYPSHNQKFVIEMHTIMRLTRKEVIFNDIQQSIKKHVLDQY